ncbi:GntR family transcriptional regulator [Nonomuraea deserti]|uniref:GntR family transcriptional regulator n=1 Tax=Nonomuraea deserti TaxID=1848322 RepID=UPI00140535BA|nr:GntR family transcriptional regulator [Nonomuraea deserti]
MTVTRADDGAVDSGEREHGVSLVHARLRDALIRGELEAGQVLSQVQLAERYGVSRTPLREALRLLEREGLVVSEPRRRVRVAPFSIEDLDQIYALRISLEILALRLTLPRLTDEAIARIAELEQTMRRHAENHDYDAWHEPHREFHRSCLTLAGDRLLADIERAADHAERYRFSYTTQVPTAWGQGLREHHEILVAVRDRDVEAASVALARHYARVALSAAALLVPEYDPRAIREALRMVLRSPDDEIV